ncbi:chlorophyllase [Actinoplanes sp. NEAU-A12]|uniref:Chlorophyllase n=1 Tax=Actinoplanes sandaracinus TaxID=3045177 RepID=A0ABT6WDV2_9ACTN|nr:chlorophyllase [Actinoplanes sandaracinus]MDI6097878.1 chlorophyllase [Actinoplanes sandaracinus]
MSRHNGRVLRRSVLTLALASAGLTACSTPAPTKEQGQATPSPSRSREQRQAGTREFAFNRGGDRPLPTKVWLPAGEGPFPLIYFSHGLTSQPDDYAELLSAWAAAGFVVAGPKYPHTWNQTAAYDAGDIVNQPADAQHVITELLTALAGIVDPQRIAAAGHSAGAITTVGLFSGSRDERLKAGLLIAGRQMPQPAPFAGAPAPLLFVQGKLDKTVTYEQAYGAYNEVSWPKAFLELPQGTHLPHRDEPSVVAATTTDFWLWSLRGDQAAKDRMPRDAAPAGLTSLL